MCLIASVLFFTFSISFRIALLYADSTSPLATCPLCVCLCCTHCTAKSARLFYMFFLELSSLFPSDFVLALVCCSSISAVRHVRGTLASCKLAGL